eukprot:1301610-Alexandrium_andersonii.AAC.1
MDGTPCAGALPPGTAHSARPGSDEHGEHGCARGRLQDSRVGAGPGAWRGRSVDDDCEAGDGPAHSAR